MLNRYFKQLILCGLMLFFSSSAGLAFGHNYRGILHIQGHRRSYLVHLPPRYDGKTKLPLVVILHGGGGTDRRIFKITGICKVADREQFVVVAPNGTGVLHKWLLTWNSFNCCGYARKHEIDDITFIKTMLDQLHQRLSIDSNRIYITGESNGGMLVYQLACKLSDTIAAIAPVAASMNGGEKMPLSPVSVVAFNGTADKAVPYNGGIGVAFVSRVHLYSQPTAYAMAFWVKADGCNAEPQIGRSGNIIKKCYAGGANGSEVVLYSIKGGNHAWPGGKKNWLFGDKPTQEISASELIWNFFAKHTKNGTVDNSVAAQEPPLLQTTVQSN